MYEAGREGRLDVARQGGSPSRRATPPIIKSERKGSTGIWIRKDGVPGTVRNTLIANTVYDNAGKAVDVLLDYESEVPAPQTTRVSSLVVRGTAPPDSVAEIFSDDAGDTQTSRATDQDGGSSELSQPVRPTPPATLRALARISIPFRLKRRRKLHVAGDASPCD